MAGREVRALQEVVQEASLVRTKRSEGEIEVERERKKKKAEDQR